MRREGCRMQTWVGISDKQKIVFFSADDTMTIRNGATGNFVVVSNCELSTSNDHIYARILPRSKVLQFTVLTFGSFTWAYFTCSIPP